MSNLSIIEEEIAKLEEEQRANQSKLALLKKSKTAMLEQEKADKKSNDLDKLEKSIRAANEVVSETSLRFVKDDLLEAVLVKLDDVHLDQYVLLKDLDLKKINKFLELYSRNAKAIEKIYDVFNESSDFVRSNFDDQHFKFIRFDIYGRKEDITIFLTSNDSIKIIVSKGIDYSSDKVIIQSGKIAYEVSMVDSYDSFYINASVTGVCKIDQFDAKFNQLLKDLNNTEVIEED